MKRYFYMVLLALAVNLFPAWAVAAEKSQVPIFSFADTSCGTWAQSQKEEYQRQTYLTWVRGFVSGYNYGSETKEISLYAMPDNNTLALYVDKYCREHPLLPFVSAAFELVKELRIKK